MHIRKGDMVVVIAGRTQDHGKRGRVLRVLHKQQRAVVEGIRLIRRHTRAKSGAQRGGIVEKEGTIHLSNLMPWCEAEGKPSKIIMKRLEDGTRVRVFKINGEALND